MLKLELPKEEAYDEEREEFVARSVVVLELEHSLHSISKWESRYEKPFLTTSDKSVEETLAYIGDMVLTVSPPGKFFEYLREEHFAKINEYINAKMTATWFSDNDDKPNKEVITAELIYYWMVAYNIPFECQHWHIKRLLTLIRVCNQKNQPEKKLSRSEIARRNRELNAKRKAMYSTPG